MFLACPRAVLSGHQRHGFSAWVPSVWAWLDGDTPKGFFSFIQSGVPRGRPLQASGSRWAFEGQS